MTSDKYKRHNATPKRIAYSKARAARPDVKAKRYACTKRYQDFKRSLIKDFTCISCDNIDPTVVQWHHVDPEQKEFEVMATLNASHDRWWNELLKCVPLCGNCHIKIHRNQLCLIPQKK